MKQSPLEHVLTSAYKVEMMSFIENHPECVDEAINLAVSNKQPYAWRAAWLLWSCIEENDLRIRKYIDRIIETLNTVQDGHLRELLKILLMMKLNEKQEGLLYNLCVSVWEKVGKRPSVRYTALKMMVKIIKKYPELRSELNLLTQKEYLESLSPGVKKSLMKLLKQLPE